MAASTAIAHSSSTEEECESSVTFKDLGVIDELCLACENLGWKAPTAIQKEAIPVAIKGEDVIGLAETGSGKTGAFALPVLQALIAKPQRIFCLVLTPTRELAFQIKEQFDALGKAMGVVCSVIVGGLDMTQQAIELGKRPHVIVGTPGRIVDHLERTNGFHLKPIKYLVLDEADRILNMDYELEVDKIFKQLSQDKKTMLFSATMTTKVNKLQRCHLKTPVRVEVSSKYQTVEKLQQSMLFIPCKHKPIYLAYILNDIGNKSAIIFCATQMTTLKVALMLRSLGFNSVPLYGKMTQNKRLGALNMFKTKQRSVLLATDVASRGLDIPCVDYVINYDVPTNSKDYIHRVGRTARAGRAGVAITFVSQYEVEVFQRIEVLLGTKLEVFPIAKEEVMVMEDRVVEAERFAKLDMNRMKAKKGDVAGKRNKNLDSEESLGVKDHFKRRRKR